MIVLYRCWLTMCLALAALPVKATAQDALPDSAPTDMTELASYCQDRPCRRNVSLTIRLIDGSQLTEQLDLHRPALTRGEVSVLLGETLAAVPEFDDDNFLGWREPQRNERRSTPQLRFKLSQDSDGSIVAEIANAGSEPVKVSLSTRIAGSITETHTPSCPIAGNGRVYDYWSEPVAELIVHEARLVDHDSTASCD